MAITPPRCITFVRRHLCADALHALVHTAFRGIPDHRDPGIRIPLADALMSAFAMFSLKDPSLLAFDARRYERNLAHLYGIQEVPSDTQMREILDSVDPEQLRPTFADVFRELQRGKALEQLVFWEGCYLLLLDGTGYFSSQKIHCDSCLQKVNHKTGEVTYHHQILGAAIAHPDHKEVIPLAPEAIVKQDGDNKNDCERNAAKRLLQKIRREHPRLKLIVVEDSLASNAPHIRELIAQRMHFILGVKPGDHPFLWKHVDAAFDEGRVTILSWCRGNIRCEISFVNRLPLNESNADLLVNFLRYAEYNAEGQLQKIFTWITDIRIVHANARLLVRGGRARWKIENETFNTLKNQGYHYEHNFGHGERHLSVVFAMLMMLGFLVDQVQQLCCPLFQAVLEKVKSKRSLWEKLRSHVYHFTFRSMQQLYEAILFDLCRNLPAPKLDTS
jgi:hypothetical protein